MDGGVLSRSRKWWAFTESYRFWSVTATILGTGFGAFMGEAFQVFPRGTPIAIGFGLLFGFLAELDDPFGRFFQAILYPRPGGVPYTGKYLPTMALYGTLLGVLPIIEMFIEHHRSLMETLQKTLHHEPGRLFLGAGWGYLLFWFIANAPNATPHFEEKRPKTAASGSELETGTKGSEAPRRKHSSFRSQKEMLIRNRRQFDTARGYFEKGKQLYTAHQLEEANYYFSQALDREPRATYFYYSGLAHLNMNHGRLAEIAFSRAIELKHGIARFYNSWGMAHAVLGNYDAALNDFDHAIEINPALTSASDNRSRILEKTGREASPP